MIKLDMPIIANAAFRKDLTLQVHHCFHAYRLTIKATKERKKVCRQMFMEQPLLHYKLSPRSPLTKATGIKVQPVLRNRPISSNRK
jgi:hypothetical protein